MRLVTVALLLLSLQGAPSELDTVVKRSSRYVDGYMKELGSIIGEERYYQEAVWEDRDMKGRKLVARRGRQLVSDFLTVPVGDEWMGIRHVRKVDDVVLDPLYRGFWRETFDESTAGGRERLQKAFTFESTRFNIGDVMRSTNLPTFPLEVLDEDNLPLFAFSKGGEEKIGTVQTWKVRFNDRNRNTILIATGIGPDQRYSISGTFWIEPATGRVFRVEVGLRNDLRENIEIGMDVRFRQEPAVDALVPASMEEHYKDKYARHELEAHADYLNYRRFSSDVRLESGWNEALLPDDGLKRQTEDSYAVKVDVRLVNVEAWVTSSSGSSVTDLSVEDFNLFEAEVPQSITNFSPVSTPYDVLLLFDRSGSTQSDWVAMQRAAEGFISNLRPQDRAGIANFDTSFRMLTKWTNTREQLGRVITGLTEGKQPGGTSFYRAVEMSLASELLPVAGRRRALVVLTDGRDNGLYRTLFREGQMPGPAEEPAFQQLVEFASRERVPIYLICISNPGSEVARLTQFFSQAASANYLNAVATRLELLAEVAGGRVMFPRRLQDIVPLYSQISRELGSAYSIGYVSNLPLTRQGFREIKVSTRHPRLRVVQSRAGYVAKVDPD